MAVKVKVSEDKCLGVKVIYTDNCVTDKLVETVQEVLKENPEVRVSFDVIGETKHLILSNELGLKLKNVSEDYQTEVGRYKCSITKTSGGTDDTKNN